MEISEPLHGLEGRHSFFENFFFKSPRPGTSIPIAIKRNVRRTAWLVTSKTMALKNAHDFFVEADVRGNGLVGADVIWADQDDHGTNEEQCHDRGLMIGFHSLKQRLVKRNWARSSGTLNVRYALACR